MTLACSTATPCEGRAPQPGCDMRKAGNLNDPQIAPMKRTPEIPYTPGDKGIERWAMDHAGRRALRAAGNVSEGTL